MKTVFAFLWLVLLLQGCTKPETDVLKVAPVTQITSNVSQTDTPKVLGFSLPGIPPENIVIDHINHEIKITIPANISATAFPASMTVTAGYVANPGNSRFPYRFDLLTERPPIGLYKQGDVYSVPIGTPYRIVTLPDGPLEITNAPASLTLETGQPLLLSVKNYYDDATSSNSVVITNQLTGQQYQGSLYTCEGASVACKGIEPGFVTASFDSDIPYGAYSLELRKANKRQARATAPLTVTKGLPFAYDDSYNPSAPGTQNRKFSGVNLIESDQIELLLKNQTGQQYKLTPTNYTTDGKSMSINIPADIKPSQYSVQFIRKGQLVPSYSRTIISRDRSQPAIISINYGAINVIPDSPLALVRGNRQGITYVISQNVTNVRLKLIPVVAGQSPVLVDVDTPRGYFTGGPDGGLPSFVVPESTPTGKYTLVLQHILTNKSVTEGEPFERLIEVR